MHRVTCNNIAAIVVIVICFTSHHSRLSICAEKQDNEHHCHLPHAPDNGDKCSDSSEQQPVVIRTANATINTTASNNHNANKLVAIDEHGNAVPQITKKSLACHLHSADGAANKLDACNHHHATNLIMSASQDKRPQLKAVSKFMFEPISRSHQMRAYSLDISSYRKSARYAGDAHFLDSNNTAHIARCGHYLNYYAKLLDEVRHASSLDSKLAPQALILSDAYGRPEAGVHMGNSFWLGSYTQCLDTKITVSSDDTQQATVVNSQYCIMTAHAPSWNKKDTLNSIRLGVCLPEACTNSMLEDHFRDKVNNMAKIHLSSVPLYSELEMTQVFCLPHPTSEIRQFSKMTIGFLAVIGLFVFSCLVATLIDNSPPLKDGFGPPPPASSVQPVAHQQQQQQSVGASNRYWKIVIIEAFSITRNFQKITHVKETNGEHFLDSLAGIKCLSLFWIIGAHSILIGPTMASNLVLFDTLNKTLLSSFYLSAHLVVDTFFAVSGILASYLMFKTKAGLLTVPEYIFATVHRYWRLTPLYLIAFWYAKSMGHLLSSGPFWDYMTSENSPRLQCSQESWLVALFHWADFKGPKEHCVPFAWFIANGIKFWLVTPIFVAAIAKSRHRGYVITALAIVANIALVFVLALKSSEIDLDALLEFRPETASNMINSFGEVYSRPYSRIAAYLVGLIAGHLLFSIETKQIQLQLSDKANTIIWTLVCATFMLLTFILKFVPPVAKDIQIYLFSLSSALIRPLWATCSCWLIFAIAQGQVKWLRKFLSSSVWQILVRLSYCGYLVQGEVLAVYMMAHNGSHLVRYTDLIAHAIFLIVSTLAVSFFAAILIEYPLIAIEELVLPRQMIGYKKRHPLANGDSSDKQQQQNIETHNCDKTRLLAEQMEPSSFKQKTL